MVVVSASQSRQRMILLGIEEVAAVAG
jgi:hypothetical protein